MNLTILYIWLGVSGFLFLTLFYYFIFPIENRARLLSFVRRKPFGILRVVGKGKELERHIVSFDRDVAKFGNKAFILIPSRVYRQGGVRDIYYNELDAFRPTDLVGTALKKKDIEEIDDERLKEFLNNPKIEKIYLNPVSFEKDRPKEEFANPELIEAIFHKQKALAEAKTLFEEKAFKFILLAVIVISALAIAFAYMTYDKLNNEITPMVTSIKSTVETLKATMPQQPAIPVIK